MKPFTCTNCGGCCGFVPVTKNELRKIRNKVNKMATEEVKRLKDQMRPPLTCMFRNMEKNQCGIYSARPEICQMFGYYEGLVCDKNGNYRHATRGRAEGMKRFSQSSQSQLPIGTLSLTITWDNLFTLKI